MANLIKQAIACDDGDRAAKIIQAALGIDSDDVANYVFPKTWRADRGQRARIIGEWLQTEGDRKQSAAFSQRNFFHRGKSPGQKATGAKFGYMHSSQTTGADQMNLL
jgi:hypothetical protein